MLKEKQKNSKEFLVKSINDFSDLLSANSIIGTPIITKDKTIIPVLKVTVGYLGGGGEYGDIKLFTKEKSHPFAGGSGAIVNMSPCGFLVCLDDKVSFVKVEDDLYEKMLERTADLVSKSIKWLWKKL